MSKRQRQADQNHHQCRCICGKVPEPGSRWRSKHLYIVLDDWEQGYSIHKLDADNFLAGQSEDGGEDSCAGAGLMRLLEPPAARLAHSGRAEDMFIASLGSKILVANGLSCNEQSCTLAYDTETAAMTTGPNLPGNLCGLTVAAGEKQQQKLYALSGQSGETGQTRVSFEVLSWVRCGGLSSNKIHRWFWDIDAPPPAPFCGSEETVAAYAVHPDGTTIFFSTEDKNTRRRERTYSFNAVRGEWRSHGRWVLPFLGQGYFDRELDAWVGLHRKDHRGYYVCACQVASRSGRAEPEWTTAKGKLFQEVPPERHLGATLTYMGDSKFCLVERVIHEDVEMEDASGHGCALHVTFFGLKYNRKGELEATDRRTTKSYAVPMHLHSFSHVAFWM
uniref:Uncharacterized protein n=1 Tax=Avena sativa TaxID=4498 RepID=A0ACD5W8Z6_AVESA